jgi:siroheme decarboxylase
MTETLDPIDEDLLNAAQGAFPVTPRPFATLGEAQSISESETIDRFEKMKEAGLIRYFGPVIATKALGFKSTLCAFKVAPDHIEEAAKVVSSHPGVSHNYEREGEINLWFTLAVPPDLDLENDFHLLAERSGADLALMLPSIKTYKIRMVLDVSKKGHAHDSKSHAAPAPSENNAIGINDNERTLLAHIETGLPFVERPFAQAAEALKTSEEDICESLDALIKRGIVRRVGMLLHHRRAGFAYNEMTAWRVPDDAVDHYGQTLAALPNVSHAYLRPAHPAWPYTLYAMFHAHSRDELEKQITEIMTDLQPVEPPRRLRSVREFKKQRLQYFSRDFYTWQR